MSQYKAWAKLWHKHKFVIPVIWRTSAKPIVVGKGFGGGLCNITGVTRLRCACGEEIDR